MPFEQPGAFPSPFPTCPSYLSIQLPQERTGNATASSRHIREGEALDQAVEAFLEADRVSDLSDLFTKLQTERLPQGIILHKEEEMILVHSIKIKEHDIPQVLFSIYITQDMKYTMTCKGLKVRPSRVRHLNPSGHIERSTTVLNIAAHLRSMIDEQDDLPLLELTALRTSWRNSRWKKTSRSSSISSWSNSNWPPSDPTREDILPIS